jgi:hypothetical protein
METEYQINNFWQTRGLGSTFIPEVGVVNESVSTEVQSDEKLASLGYTENYIESIKKGLGRYSKR